MCSGEGWVNRHINHVAHVTLSFFHSYCPFLYRDILLATRELPVKHLNCQYLKHIGRTD